MANLETMIKWMDDRKGKATYSMNRRLGPDSYDCSSAVYFALAAGSFLPSGTMGNTDSLFGHLESNGWKQLGLNSKGSYDVKRGDIFIWGSRGASGGANGHTGIFVDSNDQMIHCNFGYNGITVNDHDTIWSYNGKPAVTIYRYPRSVESTNTSDSKNTTTSKIVQKNENKVYQVNELAHVNGIWQIRCDYLCPVEFNWTQNGIACADIILTDENGKILADQVTKKGSYFIIPKSNVSSVSQAQKGSGNYYWSSIQFKNGGQVWLSTWDKKHLVYR
ncbi:peptidoglycan amidohydrolase family protein [Enterococcus sp. CWB-B31]|uniref:peptidoglycan amidohydrolase family protein n=1 Tax=Enterococcus sp. CWB-B31 TaxID=2885159 RepID=UPI001E290175|nr:peptidoglycan amidohydrolase family protein [Enterococcus sp. CWB-B31]MCB5954000.1 holin [Enterococcus sp. CWB-B31]